MGQETKPKNWGRFELVELLGMGGMGEVYKAYDPHLKRYIALKILRHENPEVVKRFLREARAQARVEHMHVCKIYESGEHEGHPFIAMQYIEGKTLNELLDELTLEEKIRIIKDVALGLHAAHSQGLIHRDVKPANVMANQTEDGQWKPFIMDFGIAREQEAQGFTSTGIVVGTPFYMSPEHARGKLEILDRRSDIYSLGVTLFELLSGFVPFEGDTPVEILMQVIQKEPRPLRKINPRIPVDIETIVMKCLEKDPIRRYGSSKELAEDLQRYLDGDPINARPATITYRIKRKIIKYKWPAAMIGIASLIIIVLIGLWLHTKWTASQRAAIAQELGQEVERIENIIRYAQLLPLHNTAAEKDMIRERIRGISEKMNQLGKLGLGPGHYALGRGYLALQDYNKAREHLETAWDTGYQVPEVAYDLGRVLGELYLQESEKVNRIENIDMRQVRKQEIEEKFRRPAVRFLRQGKQAQVESKEYIEALIAFYEEKFDQAWTILQRSMKKSQQEVPWLYQARILEGNIFLAMGREKNNYDEAVEDFQRAETAYQQVINIGKSDIRGYVGLSLVLERKIMIKALGKGGDLQPLVDEAINQCQKALQIDPAMADVYVMQASIYRWMGRDQMLTGNDPIPAFNDSIASAQDAIKLQGDNFEAYTIIGITNRFKGEYQMNHGQNPSPVFQTAVENFNKAIEINPTQVMALNGIGNVYVRKAEYEMSQGKDPTDSLDQAIANFEKALSINPKLVDLHNGLAASFWFRGGVMMAHGQDPRPSFRKAVLSLENAIDINPSIIHFYSNLGFVYLDMGRYELDYGFAPTDTVNKALEHFEKAIKINPGGNELYLGLVSVSEILTRYDYMMGKDCGKQAAQASGYFKRGLEVNPNDPLIHIRMAANYIIQARCQLDRGQSPASVLDQVERLLREARWLNPRHYEIYAQGGEITLLRARWSLKSGQDPEPYFKAAAASLDQAGRLNPRDIYTQLTRVRLNWRRAEWKISRSQPAVKEVDEGLASLQKALDINPNYAETYACRGVLLHLRSKMIPNQVERLKTELEARSSLLKAVEINGNLKSLYSPFLGK